MSSRSRVTTLLGAVLAATLVPATVLPANSASAATGSRPTDLPDNGPAALYRSEPASPAADGWPGPEAFPRTSGTGRLAGGALLWTDYLYDDHGATTASPGNPAVTAGSPSFGTYTYPAGPAHHNGADLFRAGVLLRGDSSYWRVDWTTLADPAVPIAAWTFDRDSDPQTGSSTWPAQAGVSSPGIDTALVMSSRGARLIDLTHGRTRRLPVTVDEAAHSFVVRIPARILPTTGAWRVRLAAGLADSTGTGFAQPPGTTPVQPAVYNVGFRTRTQEPAAGYNFWNDRAQTAALDEGDVSAFSVRLRWAALTARRSTAEARPTGWSVRSYVSAVDLGPGVRTDPATINDREPNYLGRVQPYAVYVPASYRPRKRTPLTFLLHSLTQNHNQYAATTPNFVQQACEDRGSICVTTLGRGPDGFYEDEAELDFWQVWQAVAKGYAVDPERTVLAGYSMGGLGTNQLAMQHPDLYAKAVALAGAVGAVPALVNLRWVPTYLASGGLDELVPVTTHQEQADALDALGYRYRWLVYPGMDHVAYELADSFADAARYMGDARRVRRPGHVTFRWTPRSTHPDLGIGTTGAYWLRGLKARRTAVDAQVDAVSAARPVRPVTSIRNRSVDPTNAPGPAVVTELSWQRGTTAPAPRPRLRLRLSNVAALRVLLADAGFRRGARGVLDVSTDGPTRIRLGGRSVRLIGGRHTVRFTA